MVGTHKTSRRKMPLGTIVDNAENIVNNSNNCNNKGKFHPKVPALKGLKVGRKELPEFVMPDEGTPEHVQIKHKMSQREKQISLGRQTTGYRNYLAQVPLECRELDNPTHVSTPRATWSCSKRTFDGYIRQWRRDLHAWDPVGPLLDTEDSQEDDSTDPNTTINDSDLSVLSDNMPDLPPLVPLPEDEDMEEQEEIITLINVYAY
eukprot:TRINITY_DN5216_c0_g1_i1.p1 TRINITY_DN5216_c0_g1~~TRINITY_DN5216_c0_g1_i1.p1  ORF type:complete len:205 (+),score=93.87 TRINITY_DN5216_c0_g1_i1:722-1336(+)